RPAHRWRAGRNPRAHLSEPPLALPLPCGRWELTLGQRTLTSPASALWQYLGTLTKGGCAELTSLASFHPDVADVTEVQHMRRETLRARDHAGRESESGQLLTVADQRGAAGP